MLSGIEPTIKKTEQPINLFTQADFEACQKQAAEKNIPQDLLNASIYGYFHPIEQAMQLSAKDKQWLYMVAFKNNVSQATEKLTLDSKIDLLYDAVKEDNLLLCQKVLNFFDKNELGNDDEGEIETLFNIAISEHYFPIAQLLLEFFKEERYISNNLICENILWASSWPKHFSVLKWFLTQAHIPADSIDPHIKGSILEDMVEQNNIEMVGIILSFVTPDEQLNEDFLKSVANACHHALITHKNEVLHMMLPFADSHIIKQLLAEATSKQLLQAMPYLLAAAEKLSEKAELTPCSKLISHEEQANYLRRLLEQNKRVLSFIYTCAQARGNTAILEVLRNPTLLVPDMTEKTNPPLIYSSAIPSRKTETIPTVPVVEKPNPQERRTRDETEELPRKKTRS